MPEMLATSRSQYSESFDGTQCASPGGSRNSTPDTPPPPSIVAITLRVMIANHQFGLTSSNSPLAQTAFRISSRGAWGLHGWPKIAVESSPPSGPMEPRPVPPRLAIRHKCPATPPRFATSPPSVLQNSPRSTTPQMHYSLFFRLFFTGRLARPAGFCNAKSLFSRRERWCVTLSRIDATSYVNACDINCHSFVAKPPRPPS